MPTYRIPPYLKIPDQSTNHIADSTEPACSALAGRPVEVLAYRNAICLGIATSIFAEFWMVFQFVLKAGSDGYGSSSKNIRSRNNFR